MNFTRIERESVEIFFQPIQCLTNSRMKINLRSSSTNRDETFVQFQFDDENCSNQWFKFHLDKDFWEIDREKWKWCEEKHWSMNVSKDEIEWSTQHWSNDNDRKSLFRWRNSRFSFLFRPEQRQREEFSSQISLISKNFKHFHTFQQQIHQQRWNASLFSLV